MNSKTIIGFMMPCLLFFFQIQAFGFFATSTIEVTGINLDKTSLSMCVNESKQLIAEVLPEDATNKNVRWISNKESVATISESGLITAKSTGTTVIIATTVDGGFTATCEVNVTYFKVIDGVLVEYLGTDVDIDIPDNLGITEIGSECFSRNASIKSVIIPEGVTKINSNAFRACYELRSILFPNSLESIGDYVFFDCGKLTSITLPDLVVSIGNFAFFSSGLTSITFSESLKSIGDNAFGQCTGLTSIVLPNLLKTIGNGAFALTGLVSVTIPSSVISIGDRAFYLCGSLSEVTVKWMTPLSTINSNVFESTNTSACSLFVPAGTKALYKAHPVWGTFGTIDDGVPVIIAVEGIKLDKTSIDLWVDEALQLTATILPKNATNQNIRWRSSKEEVAVVSSSGLVTAKAKGSAVIIVTTVEGGFIATCDVEVNQQKIVINNEAKTGNDRRSGKIVLSLAIPANILFSGSFMLILPDGIQLDIDSTCLSDELSSKLSLILEQNSDGNWLFMFPPKSLRSVTELLYTQILEIGYNVSETLPNGTYEATINNFSLEFDNGVIITENKIPVKIIVKNLYTGLQKFGEEISAYINNNRLYINSPVNETVSIYSINGVQLYNFQKSSGNASFPVDQLKRSMLIIKGSSGWVKKLISY